MMSRLDTDLAPDMRESLAYAFRELLLNAIEWGERLDPTRKVYLRIRSPGTAYRCITVR